MLSEEVHGAHVSSFLRDVPVCQRFPEKHLPCLLMEGVEVVYPEGSEIVKPGDPSTSIYVVTQGSARMVLESPTSTGKMSSVLRLLGPGDLFGLGPALDGRPYVAGLQSMTETRVLVVSRESFLRELEDHPAACRGLLGQFGEMVRACESWIISLL